MKRNDITHTMKLSDKTLRVLPLHRLAKQTVHFNVEINFYEATFATIPKLSTSHEYVKK